MDIQSRTAIGSSVMHLAASFGRSRCIKYLKEEKGISVNILANDDVTPLHAAIIRGTKDVDNVRYLIRSGADPSLKISASALKYAGLNARELAKTLLMDP